MTDHVLAAQVGVRPPDVRGWGAVSFAAVTLQRSETTATMIVAGEDAVIKVSHLMDGFQLRIKKRVPAVAGGSKTSVPGQPEEMLLVQTHMAKFSLVFNQTTYSIGDLESQKHKPGNIKDDFSGLSLRSSFDGWIPLPRVSQVTAGSPLSHN